MNKGGPLVKKDYVPMTKIYFYDLVENGDFPVFLVAYNNIKTPIDSSVHPFNSNGFIGEDDIVTHFSINFVTSLKNLERKCLIIVM